jgi:hypothetical protein
MGDVEAEREDPTRDAEAERDHARVGHAGALDAWRVAAASVAVALAVVGVGVGEARARVAHLANAARVEEPSARTESAPAPVPTTAALAPWGGGLSEPGLSAGGRSLGPAIVATGTPHVRTAGRPVVRGVLPPEVVARIVSFNSGGARLCYERGLRANPRLSGRIAVRFVIDRSGAVSAAAEGQGSTLPDPEVVGCVVRSFLSLSFPQPDEGIATVLYRLDLSPPG